MRANLKIGHYIQAKTRTLKGAGPSTSLRTKGAAPTFLV
jgi:hypothetical protein